MNILYTTFPGRLISVYNLKLRHIFIKWGCFELSRNLIFHVFIGVLIVLYLTQIAIGSKNQINVNNNSSTVTKKSDYYIFIEIEDHTLYLLQDNKVVKKYPIASGKPNTPSPVGSFKITSKGDWGGGFGGRWMGLNVPWGTYGIHGTSRPETIGWAASHGCIRMRNKDVEELYKMVSHGTPVVIANGQFGSFGRGFRNIDPGDRGADVYEVQRRLKELGFYKGYVDGIYGEGMKGAIHSFQRKNGLPVKNTITKDDYNAMEFREFE